MRKASYIAIVVKAQHDPQDPWSFTGLIFPWSLQFLGVPAPTLNRLLQDDFLGELSIWIVYPYPCG